jgi:uncharacterized protein
MTALTPYRQLSMDIAGIEVYDLDDIDQCIRLICGTQQGTDPMRPNFGINKFDFIDKPITVLVPTMVKEITRQIAMWEPRATVKKIAYQIIESQVTFTIHWISQLGSSKTTLNA